jgi:hypothetical protein
MVMANVERLRELRRVIEAAPEDKLHMPQWCDFHAPCGTAYCAAGWAAIDPWFQKNTPILEIFSVQKLGDVFPKTEPERVGDLFVQPRTLGRTMTSLAALFDLGYDAAANLFGNELGGFSSHSVTKKEVLSRIDAAIAGKPVKPYKVLQTLGW